MDPTLVCVDDTISCLQMIAFDGPEAFDNCGEAEVILINEEATLLCDPLFIKRVTRTYIARDESGNESEPCTIDLYLERIDFSLIDFPDSFTVFNGNPLQCNGPALFGDPDGLLHNRSSFLCQLQARPPPVRFMFLSFKIVLFLQQFNDTGDAGGIFKNLLSYLRLTNAWLIINSVQYQPLIDADLYPCLI